MKRAEVDRLYGDMIRESRSQRPAVTWIDDDGVEHEGMPPESELDPDAQKVVTRVDGAQLVAVPCRACGNINRQARRQCRRRHGSEYCGGRGYEFKWIKPDDAIEAAAQDEATER